MKSFFLGFFMFFLVLFSFSSRVFAQESETIYFFYGTGCPHCADVLNYFEQNNLFDKYSINKKEIYFSRENALLFNQLLDQRGYSEGQRGVPTVIMGDIVIVGDKPIIDNFEKEADKFTSVDKDLQISQSAVPEPEEKPLSLTIAAVIAGSIVDAINPCAFAVLIILMSTILSSGDSRKALYAGFAFSLSIFISYLLMGLGLYKALSIGGISSWVFTGIGALAIVLGLANLKDYFWYGKGFLMEVPMSWRASLKKVIHSVTSAKGAFGVGFAVSLFLLPCTSGPYIVILGMLAQKAFDIQTVAYLVLYNIIFVSPMLFISYAVYKGFDPNKAESMRQRRLKMLHLIAGLIMLAMGVVILLGWL